jgi:NADH:ubiquinone oxidoreductase subunit E
MERSMNNMVEINVCIGTSCHLNGSYNVVQTFQQLIEDYSLHEAVDFNAYFCMKQCNNKGVSVTVDGESFRIEPENAIGFFKDVILKKAS